MFRKKCFLDMQNAKIINYGVAFVDTVYNGIQGNADITNYKNPFSEINSLALKGALGLQFIATSAPTDMNKQWQNGDFVITNQFFPPKFLITQNNMVNNKNETTEMVKKIIDFANLLPQIGKIGINFSLVVEKDIIVKDVVLKEKIANEFSGISFTLEKEINEVQKLNLQIAGAKNIETNQNGVFVQANFDNKVTSENTIDKILNQNYFAILEQKINAVFGDL